MNIGEANNWFTVLRGLESSSSPDQVERALEAAEQLTERALAATHAGPRPAQVRALVDAAICATWEHGDVELGGPSVLTVEAKGGLL